MNCLSKLPLVASLSLSLAALAMGCIGPDEVTDEETAQEMGANETGGGEENVASDSEALTASRVMTLNPRHAPAKCLGVSGYSFADGASVVLGDCYGDANMQMTIQDVGGGYYTLRPQHSEKCLEVKNAATNWGAEIVQGECTGAINQLFRLTYKEADHYEIRAAQTNHCLDVSGNSSANGAKLVQWYCNGGYNQQFYWHVPLRSGADRDACVADPSACKPNLTDASAFQCVYGYRTGVNWGSGSRVYDELDRCAFWHDQGCWGVNLNSGVDEGNGGCPQTVNYISCVEKVMPESIEEAIAKDCVMSSLLRTGADICEPFVPRGSYYPLYSGTLLSGTKPWCAESWR